MHHSTHSRVEKKDKSLTKQQLKGLNSEQREFAEQQFRALYAQQMSKLTAELSHNKKIKENLNNIDLSQTKNLQVQYENLKNKMAEIEEKRTKKLEQKTKSFKANDEKWFHKLKQIQNKFVQKNRQAYQKAQKYRQESQHYWKSKQKRMQDFSKSRQKISRNNNIRMSSLNKSFAEGMLNRKNHKLFPLTIDKRKTLVNQSYFSSSRSIHTDKIQLDQQIQVHKQKSNLLQKQKQMLIFQKAMQKMDKIEQKRSKIIKDKQHKKSSPTKPKIIDFSHNIKTQPKNKKKLPTSSSFQHRTNSKDEQERTTKDHLQIKQRLQQQQFHQRGQIYQNALQKTRKDRIIKMIKNKIHQIKVNVLMSQRSKSNFII